MNPKRLIRARELAGLSIEQATAQLGWARGPLFALEHGQGYPPTEETLRKMAEIYGVSLEWIRGEDVELPESTRAMLRQVEHTGDRAKLTELLGSINPSGGKS